jgi:hypothetical protein
MVMVTAHSLGFWGVWLYQGLWVKEAFDQGPRINNLAGGISFLSGLALWLSSLEVARRASYETFYKLHHIGKFDSRDPQNLYAESQYVLLALPAISTHIDPEQGSLFEQGQG